MDRSLHPWLQLRRSRLQVRRFTNTDRTCELIKYVHPVAFMSPQRSDDIQAETRGNPRTSSSILVEYRYMGSRIRKIIACRDHFADSKNSFGRNWRLPKERRELPACGSFGRVFLEDLGGGVDILGSSFSHPWLESTGTR